MRQVILLAAFEALLLINCSMPMNQTLSQVWLARIGIVR